VRRIVTLLAAGGLAAASVTAVVAPAESASAKATTTPGSVAWHTCDDMFLTELGIECGTLSVPLDATRQHGQRITLALSRLEHTAPPEDYQGIMLVNPGGPGGSGLALSFLGYLVPDDVRAAYDWIGFDPRGVGSSSPQVRCIPDYFVGPRPDYDIATGTEHEWLDRVQDYVQACRSNGVGLLNHLKTVDNVHDMDAIRRALGQEQLNFYGFSYGTYLAQVYATLFPDQVRRMVLDANVDPRNVWYDANISQDYAFETVIGLFFAWVAGYDSTYHLGDTAAEVEQVYYDARAELSAQPLGRLGPSELSDAVLVAGYVQALWPDIAQGLSDLVNDADPTILTGWYEAFMGPGDDNGYAMYLATECTDAPWPRDWDFWHADNSDVAEDAPFLTWPNAWFNAPCAFWAAPAGQPVDVDGSEAPPLLLVSETLDAATPFAGSLEVRSRFPDSVLVAIEGGTTHANSLAGNECVDGRIFAYLRDGSLPDRLPGNQADVTCAPLPAPVPAAAEAAATAGLGSHATGLSLLLSRPR
jgi:pimeloyl-ACP methyl ester carboxylesterase